MKTIGVIKKLNFIDSFQWNKSALPWYNRTDENIVRRTSYGEVSQLLNTSGCSHDEPYWGWEVLGVIETKRGRLVVIPSDWVITTVHGDIVVMSDEVYNELIEKV